MALVEHQARRLATVIAANGRLDHHQRVVGDYQIGAPRLAHRFLDEAFAVMGTGRMDAFAAPVGQAQGAGAAQQIAEPGGKVAAHQIAVSGGQRPARH